MQYATILDPRSARQAAHRSISLTNDQTAAIRAIKDWFNYRTEEQQVFRVFGYAGTGKTTLIKYAIDDLGLDSDDPADVNFGTFTGKAAYVLRKKGLPCRTIHQLIYRLVKTEWGLPAHWELNEDSVLGGCELVVLDEVSMVDAEMARDLLSFGKPVLVLGDPGQLPPIKGAGAFSPHRPDVMLTEIHRQAAESPIIQLATIARTGQTIPYGEHGGSVRKVRRREIDTAQLLDADQVICGFNDTRFMLNNQMRREAGFEGVLPTGPREKIICLKNYHDRGLFNGMFLELDNIGPSNKPNSFNAVVRDEEGRAVAGENPETQELNTLPLYDGHFLDHQRHDPKRHEKDWKAKRGLIETTFGYAITCHKSQGSQWDNVIVWDDKLGQTKRDRAQWLYTAITRASEALVIAD